jgi:hypothetical protein
MLRHVLFCAVLSMSWASMAVGKPRQAVEITPDLPESSKEDEIKAAPSFRYRLSRKMIITPEGPVEQENTDAVVEVLLLPKKVVLRWPGGAALTYDVSGSDPVAITTDLGRRWVTTIRAHRITKTGSVEQIIVTQHSFVLTSPRNASLDVAVTYAAAL